MRFSLSYSKLESLHKAIAYKNGVCIHSFINEISTHLAKQFVGLWLQQQLQTTQLDDIMQNEIIFTILHNIIHFSTSQTFSKKMTTKAHSNKVSLVHSVSYNWVCWFGNIPSMLPVDSPHKWPIIFIFDVFFVVSLNSVEKQPSCRWFEKPWPLCNVTVMWYIHRTPSCLCCWKQL